MGVHTVRGLNTLVPDRGEQAARGATPLRRPQPPPPSPATFDGRCHGNGGSLRHRLLSTCREGLFAVRLGGPFGAGARAASPRCRSLFRHAGAYSSSSTPVRIRFGYSLRRGSLRVTPRSRRMAHIRPERLWRRCPGRPCGPRRLGQVAGGAVGQQAPIGDWAQDKRGAVSSAKTPSLVSRQHKADRAAWSRHLLGVSFDHADQDACAGRRTVSNGSRSRSASRSRRSSAVHPPGTPPGEVGVLSSRHLCRARSRPRLPTARPVSGAT